MPQKGSRKKFMPASKQTCLWLKGLPLLKYTNIVEPERNGMERDGEHGLIHVNKKTVDQLHLKG